MCYLAFESHIAFAETMLRDLSLDTVNEDDLNVRSLALVEVRAALRLVEMNSEHLRPLGADASVVQGRYGVTWEWSAALHAHRERPDGIRYRARHDDPGFSVALFERARRKMRRTDSTPLSDPSLAAEIARWLDRYNVGLTT
ncbi:MAG: RES family NAD+ phosphorylase [Gemmatimonadetes bacterium]|nr:RES family NAD+ phosphorylase [Gemmatimonadota bacterium]